MASSDDGSEMLKVMGRLDRLRQEAIERQELAKMQKEMMEARAKASPK
jgi:hypothetical protein